LPLFVGEGLLALGLALRRYGLLLASGGQHREPLRALLGALGIFPQPLGDLP
jgi:hypothetical protein